MAIAHAVDIFGILLALGGAVALVWRIQNAPLGVALGGLWIWGGIHFTGKLIRHFDSAHEWSPSDTIWFHSGWVPGLLTASAILLLKFLVRKKGLSTVEDRAKSADEKQPP